MYEKTGEDQILQSTVNWKSSVTFDWEPEVASPRQGLFHTVFGLDGKVEQQHKCQNKHSMP